MAVDSFGISDFVKLLSHAKSVYRQCRDSKHQYLQLQDDVLALRNSLENVEDHINGGQMSFSLLPMLFEIGRSCRDTLHSIEVVLGKDERMSISSRQSLETLEGNEREFHDLQGRLQDDISALKNFYRTIITDHELKLSSALDQLMKDVNSQQHAVISMPSLKAAVGSVKDQSYQDAWASIVDGLKALNVDEAVVNENRQFISSWIATSIERTEFRKSATSLGRVRSAIGHASNNSQSSAFTIPSPSSSGVYINTRQSGHHSISDEPSSLNSLSHEPDRDILPLNITQAQGHSLAPDGSLSSREGPANTTSDRPDSALVPVVSSSSTDETTEALSPSGSIQTETRDRQASVGAVGPLRISRKQVPSATTSPGERFAEPVAPTHDSATHLTPNLGESNTVVPNNNQLSPSFVGSRANSVLDSPNSINHRESLPSYADAIDSTSNPSFNQETFFTPGAQPQYWNGPAQGSRRHLLSSQDSQTSRTDLGDSDSEYGLDVANNGFSSSRTALIPPDPYLHPALQSGSNSRPIPTSEPNMRRTASDRWSDKESLSSPKDLDYVGGKPYPGPENRRNVTSHPYSAEKMYPVPNNTHQSEDAPEVWCDCQLKVRQCCDYLGKHNWIAAETQLCLCINDCQCGNMTNPKIVEELWFLRGACLSFEGEFRAAIQCFSRILLEGSYSNRYDPLLRLTALIWIGDAYLCTGRPQSTIIAWVIALECLESEIVNLSNPTELRARILVPICERLKQEVAYFKGFTLPLSSWDYLVEASPWILTNGKNAQSCADQISIRLESVKSIRLASGARGSGIKYGPSSLIKGRLSNVLSGIMRIDVENYTNHLMTWDPFFCVKGATSQCEIAKVPLHSALRQGPNPSSIKTKFGSTFSYSDFTVNKTPEAFTAMLKQPFKESKADYVWLENGDLLCSWPLREPMLPFSHCTLHVKVVKYRRTNALGLQLDSNVLSSRITFEYVQLKDRAAEQLLAIFKRLSKS